MSFPKPQRIGPEIAPCAASADQPFFSVMIPIYNRMTYLPRALKAVLEQDLGPKNMQIEVVDDCSPNPDAEKITREIGRGRVSFFRQPRNLGLIPNWNDCLNRARGRFIHLFHDDDLVKPGFYQRLQAGLTSAPEAGAAFCRHHHIDDKDQVIYTTDLEQPNAGLLVDFMNTLGVMQRIQFASIVVRRDAYVAMGGFRSDVGSAADWEMWQRLAIHYPFWYEPQPLASFRRHAASESTRLSRQGTDLADTRLAIAAVRTYLPADKAQLSALALEHYARGGLQVACNALRSGDLLGALVQLREALLCSQSPNTYALIQNGLINELAAMARALREKVAAAAAQRDPASLQLLAQIRRGLAEAWPAFPPQALAVLYTTGLGAIQESLRFPALANLPLDPSDQKVVGAAVAALPQHVSVAGLAPPAPQEPRDYPKNGGLSFVTPLAYDYEHAFNVIRTYYAIADEIILGMDQDHISWSGRPYRVDQKVFDGFLSKIDTEKKIRLVQGNFHSFTKPMDNDTHERRTLSTACRPGNWIIQVDSDEILVNADEFKTWIRDIEGSCGVMCRYVTVFKILGDSALVIGRDEFGQLCSRHRAAYTTCRNTSEPEVLCPLVLLHLTWGKTEAEIQQKLVSWGHSQDFDISKWLEFWKGITLDNYESIRDFHPLHGPLWPNLIRIPWSADYARMPAALLKTAGILRSTSNPDPVPTAG